MKSLLTLALVALLLSQQAPAQDAGYWKATSKTAHGITGDIGISADKLTINFSAFTIADIRPLSAEESLSAFNIESASAGLGKLYRLNIPAGKALLHRNTMCGAEDTEWMATFASGRSLQVAFFSGGKMPVFTPDAVANSTSLCGTFSYSR